jgi:beta-lactamase superfamily II metal-dependent hydrolase
MCRLYRRHRTTLSLVMRIQDGTQSFLLSGDIEQRVENELVDEQAPLAADFRKVPHHGARHLQRMRSWEQ